tara:strand:- start:329 stop:613 length:285 start_codon:yes stop_codon:yes gene_type:complete
MDDTALALMARMDMIRDDVTDLKSEVRQANAAHADHTQRLDRLEDATECIQNDLTDIKNGPVYSLDRFITKRVAQTTGGLGAIGLLFALLFGLV